MATYTYNQKRTRELQDAIRKAPYNYEVWFQPTHHCGCVQVLSFKEGTKSETYYCINTFHTSNTGHESFREKVGIVQNDCLQLNESWVALIMAAKSIKFKANVRNGSVFVSIEVIKRAG